jgi:O-antigen/teichoic acid export membrane protein
VFPELSKLVHRGDVDSVRALTRRIRATGAAVVLPVCLLTTLLAGVAIPWIFGESFSEAVPLTRIMVWQLVWIPFVWVPGLLLSLGRARLLATMTAIDAISYLLLLLALVPAFGAAGAAWATLLRFVGWTAMAAWIAPRVEADLEARVR